MMNSGFHPRRISPRKIRAVRLPKIKVERNPREKSKPRVPQFSLLLKKQKMTSPENRPSDRLDEESKDLEAKYQSHIQVLSGHSSISERSSNEEM